MPEAESEKPTKPKMKKKTPRTKTSVPDFQTIAPEDVYLDSVGMARVLNSSVRNLSNLTRDGILVKVSGGVFCLMPNIPQFLAFKSRTERPNTSYEAERTRLTKANADFRENELAVQDGSLIQLHIAEQSWSAVLEVVRARLQVIGSRIAPQVIDLEGDQRTVNVIAQKIDEVVAEALTELMNTEIKYQSDTDADDADVIHRGGNGSDLSDSTETSA